MRETNPYNPPRRGRLARKWSSDSSEKEPGVDLGVGCVVALLLASAAPEMRIGWDGFTYPAPGVGEMAASGLPLFTELCVGLVAAWVLLAPRMRGSRWPRGWDTAAVAATGIWAIVIYWLAPILQFPQGLGAFGHFRMTVEGVVVYLAARSIGWTNERVATTSAALTSVAAWHGLVICVDFVHPGLFEFATSILEGAGAPRYSGLFNQPSRAAIVMALGSVAGLTLAIGGEGWTSRYRLLFGGMAVLAMAGVVLAQTRAVTAGFAGGLLGVLVFATKSVWKRLIGLIGIVAAGAALLQWMPTEDLAEVGIARFRDPGVTFAQSRGDILWFSASVVAQAPLGTGYDALLAISGERVIPHAHNTVLQQALMFGWLAAVVLVGLTARGLWGVAKPGFRLQESTMTRALVGVPLAVFVVGGLTETYLITNIGYLFWILLAQANEMRGRRLGRRGECRKGPHARDAKRICDSSREEKR